MTACRERAPSWATAPLPRLVTCPWPPQPSVPPSSNENLAAAAMGAASARDAEGGDPAGEGAGTCWAAAGTLSGAAPAGGAGGGAPAETAGPWARRPRPPRPARHRARRRTARPCASVGLVDPRRPSPNASERRPPAAPLTECSVAAHPGQPLVVFTIHLYGNGDKTRGAVGQGAD